MLRCEAELPALLDPVEFRVAQAGLTTTRAGSRAGRARASSGVSGFSRLIGVMRRTVSEG